MERVLVVFEPGRGGAAVLALARRLADQRDAAVTVVGVVPLGKTGSRCGNSAADYNAFVADVVARDVAGACEELRGAGVEASGRVLAEDTEDVLADFAAAGGFELVLLPARRRLLRAAGHPAAERLRQIAGCEIRVVDARPPSHAGQAHSRR